jgi:capsular polysaccharide biosynthesis protein
MIYVSRAGTTAANSDRRRFLSEAALEGGLRELGFAVVAPELLDVDEQIDLFRNADTIVACRGAALANAIYCRPDTTIVEVVPIIPGFEGYRWVRDICAIVGCQWHPYFCRGVPPEKPVMTADQIRPNAGFAFDVDVADLIAFVERSMTPQAARSR